MVLSSSSSSSSSPTQQQQQLSIGIRSSTSRRKRTLAATTLLVAALSADAFTPTNNRHGSSSSALLNHHRNSNVRAAAFTTTRTGTATYAFSRRQQQQHTDEDLSRPSPSNSPQETFGKFLAAGLLGASLLLNSASPAFAENELSAKYGGGLDTSLVDQTCLVDSCGVQAKACLADDPSCRKGLTCTAKCLGDNSCITGCMARYGNEHLDDLLKCTIEDNECIKVAILPGGADEFGQEPRAPAPTVQNFNLASMQGSWYKVIGYNPNYDCYACQRNTFSAPQVSAGDKNMFGMSKPTELQMNVEFSMPHLLPDGSPPPPSGARESIQLLLDGKSSASDDNNAQVLSGAQSIGLNDYHTRETMVFDQHQSAGNSKNNNLLTLNKGTAEQVSYARTAHSEGEMFGLKFWENWYILGENAPDSPDEFKFVYFNGKTRQNTYDGAFVYSRTKELSPESMKQVYQIAQRANMNVDQFCRIRNGCFTDDSTVVNNNNNNGDSSLQQQLGSPNNPFRGIIASTKVSELLGVEPVAAQESLRRNAPTAPELTVATNTNAKNADRAWWYEVGDYLENPHRHFETMDRLRVPVEWPADVVNNNNNK